VLEQMSNPLPKAYNETFERLRQRLHKLFFRDWLLLGFCILLVSLLVFIVLDRIFFVDGWVRPLFFVIGFVGLLLIGPYRYYKKAYAKRSEEKLTNIIKIHKPRLGDRIQGALEISKRESGASRELELAALDQIGREVEKLDINEVMTKPPHHLYFSGIGITLALIVLGGCLAPKQVSNAAKRFLFPVADIQRYSAIRFEKIPENHYVIKGEPFELNVKLKENSFSDSAIIGIGKLDGESPVPKGYDDGFLFSIPALEKTTNFTVQAGDAYQTIKIIPRSRPKISSMELRQKLPEYLKLEDRVLHPQKKRIQILQGSSLQLAIESNEHLGAVIASEKLQFKQSENTAQSQRFLVEESFSTNIGITDKYGIGLSPERSIHFDAVEDIAPTSRIYYKEKEFTLLPHETVEFKISAEDDYGINAVYLRIDSLNRTSYRNAKLAINGRPDARKISQNYIFNPEVLQLVPDSYRLTTEAFDYLEQGEPAYSDPIILHLLSYDAHANLVRSRFTSLLDKLDEYYQDALGNHQVNQLIAREYRREPYSFTVAKKMKDSLKKERKSFTLFKQLSTSAIDLSKDTLRNKELDGSVQIFITLLSRRLQIEFPPKFSKEISVYESAFDDRFSFPVREAYLDEAIATEAEALAELRKLILEMREFDRRFEAGSFAQRLQVVASDHFRRAKQIIGDYEVYAGKIKSQLDPMQEQSNMDFINAQVDSAQILRNIESDLRNYAAYAKKPDFARIADTINSSDIYSDMRAVEISLANNARFRAISMTKDIGEQIQSWAGELSAAIASGSMTSGGGGEGANTQEQDAEFMFRIMEIIRDQQNLRGKTRALDQQKKLQQEM